MASDAYVKIHPEQRDSTRAARKRNCTLGFLIIAIVSGTIALIVVYSKSTPSSSPARAPGASMVYAFNASTMTPYSATVAAVNSSEPLLCSDGASGLAIRVGDIRTATELAGMRDVISGLPLTLFAGAGRVFTVGGQPAVVGNLTYSVLVTVSNESWVKNITLLLPKQLGGQVVHIVVDSASSVPSSKNASIEYYLVCMDAVIGASRHTTPGVNFKGVEVASTGSYVPRWTEGLVQPTGWYQSDTRNLIVVAPQQQSTWTNASGSWRRSDQGACLFDVEVTYASAVRPYEDALRVGEWLLVDRVVGSSVYPAALKQSRLVHAFVSISTDSQLILADATLSNTTDIIAATYTLPDMLGEDGSALYLDHVDINAGKQVDFATVPDFPSGCPARAETSWEGGLSQFVASKFASSAWAQLLM